MKQYTEAMKYYDTVENYNAENTNQTIMNKAYCYLVDGQYNKAIQYFDKILNKDFFVFNNIGAAYLGLGKNDEAIKYFNLAIQSIGKEKNHPHKEVALKNKEIALAAKDNQSFKEGSNIYLKNENVQKILINGNHIKEILKIYDDKNGDKNINQKKASGYLSAIPFNKIESEIEIFIKDAKNAKMKDDEIKKGSIYCSINVRNDSNNRRKIKV
jgi:tetratricopeptide (TPR) repeat protein